jgi:integrase/recombinase XerD
MTTPGFPALLQSFFTDRLMRESQASPHTIASYRDTFRLLVNFAQQRLRKDPCTLQLENLDAAFITRFLNHLEQDRGNCVRTRNTRLAAIHSFFRYVALHEPQHNALIQRVLAIPNKRYERKEVEFLTRVELDALLAAPDLSTWIGRRDRALLCLAIETGLRVSELTGLRCEDVVLTHGAHVHCHGKGRKERCTPLRKPVTKILRQWLRERSGAPSAPLFPSIRGGSLSRDAVEDLVARLVAVAGEQCPSLAKKRVSPHTLRHSTAMDLLQSGVDQQVIALWLGHERPETTQAYLHANLELKQRALDKATPYHHKPGRYHPDNSLIHFLESL